MKKTSKTWPDVWYEVDFPFLAGPWSWDRETSAHISRNFLRWICVCVCMLEHLMDVPSSRSSLWFQDARVDEQSTNTSTNSIRDMWGLEDQGDQTARWQESQSQKRLLKNTFQPLTYGSYDFQKSLTLMNPQTVLLEGRDASIFRVFDVGPPGTPKRTESWKWMVGIRSFPFGAFRPILRGRTVSFREGKQINFWWDFLLLQVATLPVSFVSVIPS